MWKAKAHQVNTSPPFVRPRIHHPQLREWIITARLRSMNTVDRAKVVVRVRVELGGVLDLEVSEREGREEAVVQEAALEKEMDQSIKAVPDEEEPKAVRRRGRENEAGDGVRGPEDDENRGERCQGGLIEEIRGKSRRHGCIQR